ncbi:MAG TPA: hypothetical protein VE288_06915 [Rubrobacteraceae bacterium]|jgi:hypothetical protein|nr:hypothetical protein [Rubrobacteraceae bacterium]
MQVTMHCDEDERVRAVLISAEGAMFSAGGDLNEFVDAGDELPAVLKEPALCASAYIPCETLFCTPYLLEGPHGRHEPPKPRTPALQ